MTRAILHIGVEKTGSTSIQSAIIADRDSLSTNGIHVSRATSAFGRHDFLPILCGQSSMTEQIRCSSGISEQGLEDYAAGMMTMLREEAKSAPDHTHLFSSEHCHTILYTCDCVSKVAAMLLAIYSDVRIILYIRRQDRIALSYYSTHLRLGGAGFSPFEAIDRSNLNYEELLYRWTSAFGADHVDVRIYDDIGKSGRSVVEDFAEAIGCPGVLADSRQNQSLGPTEQRLMQMINSQMAYYDGNTIRSAISLVSRSSRDKERPAVSRSEALDFMSTFSTSNEAVRGAYFPHRSSLFDEDYSNYADEMTPAPSDALLALAIDSLAEGGRIISDLERKLILLEASRADETAAGAPAQQFLRSGGKRYFAAMRPRIPRQIIRIIRP